MASSGVAHDDFCCYCSVFGVKTTVNKPGSDSCDCRYCWSQVRKVWQAGQKVFPVPALTLPVVRGVGVGCFIFGLLGVMGIFITLSVSFIGRYPGPDMCSEYMLSYGGCSFSLVETSNVHTVHDKLFIITDVAFLVFNGGGIFATVLQSRRGLKLVGMLLLVVFWVQVIHSAVMGGTVENRPVTYPVQVLNEVRSSMLRNLNTTYKENKHTWRKMQNKEGCCGVIDFEDYVHVGRAIPDSCKCSSDYNSRYRYNRRPRDNCKFYYEKITNKTIEVKEEGCLDVVTRNSFWRYRDTQSMLWKVCLGLAFVQVAPIIFCLVLGFFKRSDEVAYKRIDIDQQQHSIDNLPMLPSTDYADKTAPPVVSVEQEEHTSQPSSSNV